MNMQKRLTLWSVVISLSLAIAAPALAQDEPADDAPPADDSGAAPADDGSGAAPADGTDAAATDAAPADGTDVAPSTDATVEGAPGALTKANWPTALVDRPITLAKGMLEIRGNIGVGLSKGATAKAVLIAPDIYYGVSDKLSIGLVNGNGICLGSKENCPGGKVFNDIGVDSIFAFLTGSLNVGSHVSVVAATLDPKVLLRANVGVLGQKTIGKINILFDPSIGIGLTERDFNKESIAVPLEVDFQATPKLAVSLFTGIGGPLDGFGDAYAIPVGVGALFGMNNKMDFGGAFTFSNLAGKGGSADFRGLSVFVNYRL
jgi:hypothetical protein